MEEVFTPSMKGEKLDSSEPVVERAQQLGGFDHVVDPFFDIHLTRVLPLLKPHGSYIPAAFMTRVSVT